MVVHVVYRRRENSWRGADSSVRFLGAAMSSNLPSKHHVRLATSSTGRSGARTGGMTLRATSPPPLTISIASAAGWDSRKLRLEGGDEELKEVVVVGDKAGDASERAADTYGVVFDAPPTDDEVHAAVASIQQVFENPSAADSDAVELQAIALPIAGLPSSGMFVNYFSADSDISEKQIVNSPSNIGLEDCMEPAALALNSTALVTRDHQNVLDAFQLLQEDSSVQKMVMALSTDKAVWDAVMNNDVVQEFKKSFQDAKETDNKGCSTTPPGMMKWVLENTQAKIKEFLEKILQLVHTLFQAGSKDYDLSDDLVRMSFMLSVFVFIVVTIARIK
ncbi:uncharacterized protein [Lolium perenne]|uniref:uncharacterized protein n=1 Tax=Lolium perenne TaxID=4522 RepID=UPI0021EAAD4A|nr:uncharacterized protein LOC127335842 [Lolium perenne]